MLFLVRSAVCIGVVVALLPHSEPRPQLGEIAQAAGKAATRQMLGLCTASPNCMAAGLSMLQPAPSEPSPLRLRAPWRKGLALYPSKAAGL